MEYAIFGIIVPLLVAALLISTVYTLVRIVLDLFKINFVVFRLGLFFLIYYYVGEYVFNILERNIMENISDIIKFIYMPVHFFIGLIN